MSNKPTARKINFFTELREHAEAFSKLSRDESGAVVIEYALIASLISAALISTLEPLRVAVGAIFGRISAAVGG